MKYLKVILIINSNVKHSLVGSEYNTRRKESEEALRLLKEKSEDTNTDLVSRGQFSLVRYMKCGVGICGSCCLDPEGLRVCRDGPVFAGDVVEKSREFGTYSRDASGSRTMPGGH